MRRRELEAKLQGADPVDVNVIVELARGPGGQALVEAILAEEPGREIVEPVGRRRHRRAAAGVFVATATAAILILVVLLIPGGGEAPLPATPRPPASYGVELVRFANETPLLLLRAPGWRVADVRQASPQDGEMEFARGSQSAQLNWRPGPYEMWVRDRERDSVDEDEAEVLGHTARVFRYACCGRPGLDLTALWREDGRVLEFRSLAPSLAAFERRLGAIHKVPPQVWLGSLPPRVIKAADRDRVVAGMLGELPLPPGFSAADLPGPGLTTSRSQILFEVVRTVACAWRTRWLTARESGNAPAAEEAVRVMATAEQWPLLRRSQRLRLLAWDVIWSGRIMPSGRWALHCREFR